MMKIYEYVNDDDMNLKERKKKRVKRKRLYSI